MIFFRETPLWSMGLIQLYTWMTWIAHSITGDLSSSGFSDLSHIRCHTRAYFRFRWDLRIFTEVTCAMIDDFMIFVLWTCRAPDAILGHIFHFRCDLWIFAYVACSMIDDFMSSDFWPIVHSMSILGHIFCFRCDLWFFTYVACSMIDDFMSPDFWPVIRSMPYWGILPFWMRFTDLGGVVRLFPFMRRTSRRWSICYLYDDFLGGASRELPS